MRTFVLLIIATTLFCPAIAQCKKIVVDSTAVVAVKKRPAIKFEIREHKVDTISISRNPKCEHTCTFTNTGDADLHILQVASGCGCTTPKYTKKPIKPGKKGSIKVEYDATGRRPGYYRKSVTVYSNDPSSYVRLFIEGIMVE